MPTSTSVGADAKLQVKLEPFGYHPLNSNLSVNCGSPRQQDQHESRQQNQHANIFNT